MSPPVELRYDTATKSVIINTGEIDEGNEQRTGTPPTSTQPEPAQPQPSMSTPVRPSEEPCPSPASSSNTQQIIIQECSHDEEIPRIYQHRTAGGYITIVMPARVSVNITKRKQGHQQSVYAQQGPVQQVPVQQVPVQQVPVQQVPVQQVPVEQVPIQQVPIQQVPIQQVPIQQVPIQQVPIQHIPVQQIPVQQVPIQQVPIQQVPIQQVPIQQVPIQQVPIQQVPIQQVPIQQVPIQHIPVQQVPVQHVPVQQVQQQAVPQHCSRHSILYQMELLLRSCRYVVAAESEQPQAAAANFPAAAAATNQPAAAAATNQPAATAAPNQPASTPATNQPAATAATNQPAAPPTNPPAVEVVEIDADSDDEAEPQPEPKAEPEPESESESEPEPVPEPEPAGVPRIFELGKDALVPMENGQLFLGTLIEFRANECLVRFDDGTRKWAPFSEMVLMGGEINDDEQDPQSMEETAEQPTVGTAEQPTVGTAEQPTEGTAEQPTEGTAEQPTEGTAENSTEGTAEQSKETEHYFETGEASGIGRNVTTDATLTAQQKEIVSTETETVAIEIVSVEIVSAETVSAETVSAETVSTETVSTETVSTETVSTETVSTETVAMEAVSTENSSSELRCSHRDTRRHRDGELICSKCVPVQPPVAATINDARDMKNVFNTLTSADQLPYKLDTLKWNETHQVNTQGVYCYCGTDGNWAKEMIQCCRCYQWFHERCIRSLQYPIFLGDTFYLFVCSICNHGHEFVRRRELTWTNLAYLALFNLLMRNGPRLFDLDTAIVRFIEDNVHTLQLPQKMLINSRNVSNYQLLQAMKSDNRFVNGRELQLSDQLWTLRESEPPAPVPVKLPVGQHVTVTENLLRKKKFHFMQRVYVERSFVTDAACRERMLGLKFACEPESVVDPRANKPRLHEPNMSASIKPQSTRKPTLKRRRATNDSEEPVASGSSSMPADLDERRISPVPVAPVKEKTPTWRSELDKLIPPPVNFDGPNNPFYDEVFMEDVVHATPIREARKKRLLAQRDLAAIREEPASVAPMQQKQETPDHVPIAEQALYKPRITQQPNLPLRVDVARPDQPLKAHSPATASVESSFVLPANDEQQKIVSRAPASTLLGRRKLRPRTDVNYDETKRLKRSLGCVETSGIDETASPRHELAELSDVKNQKQSGWPLPYHRMDEYTSPLVPRDNISRLYALPSCTLSCCSYSPATEHASPPDSKHIAPFSQSGAEFRSALRKRVAVVGKRITPDGKAEVLLEVQ